MRLSRDIAPPWARLLREAQRPLELPGLTCTRNSVATWAGESYGVNVPRLRRIHVPGYGSLAVAMSEANRTNLLTNTNTSGAIPGVLGSGGALPAGWTNSRPTGVTVEVLSATGSTLTVRINGTSTSATALLFRFGLSAHGSFTSGVVASASVVARIVSGTASTTSQLLRARITELTSSDVYVAESSSPVYFPAAPRRFVATRTAGATGSRADCYLVVGSYAMAAGEVFDNLVVEMSSPQLEIGAYASTPIATSDAAATRAGDVITAPISIGQVGTLFSSSRVLGPGLLEQGANRRLYDANAALTTLTGAIQAQRIDNVGAASVNELNLGPPTETLTVAQSWDGSGHRGRANGGAEVVDASYAAPWWSSSSIVIGNRSSGDRALCGATVLLYWPRVLSAAEITTLDRVLRPLLAQVPLW